MKTVSLIESKPSNLELSANQAEQIRMIGRTLRSQKLWWGDTDDTDDTDDSDPSSRTAIDVHWTSPSSYDVTVSNAIGAIGLSDLQLLVQPKIPMAHLLYLLAESQQLPPRSSEERASVKSDEGFFALVVRWFLDACERLLRLGLDRDYGRVTADLPFARGRVDLIPTARSIFAGRPKVRCEFDYFSEDTSLNRVLRRQLGRSWPPLLLFRISGNVDAACING